MKEITYSCDKCLLPIDGETTPVQGNIHMVGEANLYQLDRTYAERQNWGHNGVPAEGWHFHGYCFSIVVDAINKLLPKKPIP